MTIAAAFDYLRSFNWAMAAIPEFAAKRQNHRHETARSIHVTRG